MPDQPGESGAIVERFVVERTLGRGGMATVYLARDRTLDRPVAVKVLAEQLADDEGFRQRFLREARLAAKLVHPNVVQVYDVGEDDRGPYIVMEYVDGKTLADELREHRQLPPAEVVEIGIQLCSALDAAHAERLVHRDIKPQNVLRRRDGQVKLADFGIARSLAAPRHTEIGTVLGTASYLAPEQARGDPVTGAADIYSLGVVLYELLTGRTPISATTLTELFLKREQGAITPPSKLAPVPAKLETVVMRCLALRPEYRPASAAALAHDLAASLDDPATKPLPATTATPALHSARGRRKLIVAAIATAIPLALIAILVATLAASGSNNDPATTTQTKPVTPATAAASATTTTGTAGPLTASAALIRDVASGESAGTVDPGSGQAISGEAERAVADAAAGKPDQAANDLQQAALQIANGRTTSAEAAKLQSDLAALAAALGLGAAAATPPSRPAPNPGHHRHPPGHGHGHGHGPG